MTDERVRAPLSARPPLAMIDAVPYKEEIINTRIAYKQVSSRLPLSPCRLQQTQLVLAPRRLSNFPQPQAH